MKKMLCLQDVSGVSEVDLAERLRIITGWKACRTEECERRFEIDGEEAVLRCRETELQPPVKNSELRLIAKEGIVIMAAKLLPLREMTVVYTSKELTKLSTVVEKLCCRMSLIIAEPDLKQRLAQENGTYDFRKLPAYKNGSLQAMAVCHLRLSDRCQVVECLRTLRSHCMQALAKPGAMRCDSANCALNHHLRRRPPRLTGRRIC